MQSNIKLYLASDLLQALNPKLSFSHYLAHVELFEYDQDCNDSLIMSIARPSFLMVANGRSNSCQLSYHPAGTFQKMIHPGCHKLLLIELRPEWVMYKCENLTELQSLIMPYRTNSGSPVILPSCSVAKGLLKSFREMKVQTTELNMDKDGYIFLNRCISKYYGSLLSRAATSQYHQHKAAAIASFISENFASEVVDDLPKLAAKFMVSERHLERLARMAFGIPLHSQVIKIRMNSGLNHLHTSNKPVHEIAGLIGYREPCYFSRAFKKCFGISPTYWAKM